MKRAIIIRPEAERDIAEAHGWYESKAPGLGADFLLSVDTALSSIQQNPQRYAAVHRRLRRALTGRFPYGIFYVVEEARIVVIAVIHASRDPETWRRRI